jgi:hypothetical protein
MRKRLRIIIYVGAYASLLVANALVPTWIPRVEAFMKEGHVAFRLNISLARAVWGSLTRTARDGLKELTTRYAISVALGDVQFIDGRWYVTHAGLLRIAQRMRCCGIKSVLVERLSDPLAGRWFFKSTVYKSARSRGFVGFGDADPSNVSSLLRGAEMRVAETRAVNRALRKAYGIGLCSVEELGWSSGPSKSSTDQVQKFEQHTANGSNNGQPRLRDQLCVLIRQFNLDPTLVKAYAADFCGTQTLSGASRDRVESFISHLSTSAKENRDSLVCKLNSYSQTQEAKS